jgi:glutaredoxin
MNEPDTEQGLIVYSRRNCHLCEEMEAALHQLAEVKTVNFQVKYIDGQPGLEALYSDKVPVLTINGHEICHYELDIMALNKHL